MNSVGLSAGQVLVRVAWHDEIADASGVGHFARRSARRVVRSSTLCSSTLRSSSSAAAASERQPIEMLPHPKKESTNRIRALRVLHGAAKSCRFASDVSPRSRTGLASPLPRPRSLLCTLHTSTRAHACRARSSRTHHACVPRQPCTCSHTATHACTSKAGCDA